MSQDTINRIAAAALYRAMFHNLAKEAEAFVAREQAVVVRAQNMGKTMDLMMLARDAVERGVATFKVDREGTVTRLDLDIIDAAIFQMDDADGAQLENIEIQIDSRGGDFADRLFRHQIPSWPDAGDIFVTRVPTTGSQDVGQRDGKWRQPRQKFSPRQNYRKR